MRPFTLLFVKHMAQKLNVSFILAININEKVCITANLAAWMQACVPSTPQPFNKS